MDGFSKMVVCRKFSNIIDLRGLLLPPKATMKRDGLLPHLLVFQRDSRKSQSSGLVLELCHGIPIPMGASEVAVLSKKAIDVPEVAVDIPR